MIGLRLLHFCLLFLLNTLVHGQWISLGPFGGRATAMIARQDTVFVGSDNGIFKSINNGESWIRESNGMPVLFKIKRFVYADSLLLAATNLGIFIYSAESHSWSISNNSPSNVVDLVITENAAKKILYATDGNIIYSSENKGQSWTSLLSPYYGQPILFLGTLQQSVFFTTGSNSIYCSSDQKTWKQVGTSFWYSPRAFLEKEDTLFYMGAGDFSYLLPGTLAFKSIPYATNSFSTAICAFRSSLFISNYAGRIDQVTNQSWIQDTLGFEFAGNVTSITSSNDYMYASNAKGIWRKQYLDNRWKLVNSGLVNATITTLFSSENSLLAGTYGNAYKSVNHGISWQNFNSGFPKGVNISGLHQFKDSLYASSILSGIVEYTAVSFPGSVYAYDPKAGQWHAVSFFEDLKKDIFAMQAFGNDFYVAAKDTVYQSSNGITWAKCNTGIKGSVIAFCVNAKKSLFAISDSNRIYRIDAGKTSWSELVLNQKVGGLYSIAFINNTIFVGTQSGLLSSADNGITWAKVTIPGGDFPVRSFASFGNDLYIGGSPGSVIRSPDLGKTWTDISRQLPKNISIDQLSANKNFVYAGTNGNSIWRLPVALFYPTGFKSEQASEITGSTGTISGLIVPHGYSSRATLIYSKDVSFKTFDTIPFALNPVNEDSVLATFPLNGLTEKTTYYYRLKAINSAGVVTLGTIKFFTTGTFTRIDTTASLAYFKTVAETDSAYGNKVTTATAPKIGIVLNQLIAGTKVRLYYRSLTRNNLSDTMLTSANGTYTFIIPASVYDEIGVAYHFVVNPPAGFKSKITADTISDTIHIALHFSKGILVGSKLRTGAASRSYNLLSFPLVLKDSKSGSMIYKVVGVDKPDDTKYRLLTYVGKNGNYKNIWRINPENLESGKGYWFIARNLKTTFNTGEGSTVANHPAFDGINYRIVLDTGYNQIGNPYLLNVSWSDVLAASGNPTLGPLIGYVNKGDSVSLTSLSKLEPFSGGYVYNKSKSPVLLKVPARRNTTLNIARLGSGSSFPLWVPMSVESGLEKMDLGGIGIHDQASTGIDEFDELAPELPGGFPAMTFSGSTAMIKDIKPANGEGHSWDFQISGINDVGRLSWKVLSNFEGKKLFLEDLSDDRIVDMTQIENCYFKGNRKFKVHYGTSAYLGEAIGSNGIGLMVYSASAPKTITVSFHLPEKQNGEPYKIKLHLLELTGKSLFESDNEFPGGTYSREIENPSGESGIGLLELVVDESIAECKRYYVKVIFR